MTLAGKGANSILPHWRQALFLAESRKDIEGFLPFALIEQSPRLPKSPMPPRPVTQDQPQAQRQCNRENDDEEENLENHSNRFLRGTPIEPEARAMSNPASSLF